MRDFPALWPREVLDEAQALCAGEDGPGLRAAVDDQWESKLFRVTGNAVSTRGRVSIATVQEKQLLIRISPLDGSAT